MPSKHCSLQSKRQLRIRLAFQLPVRPAVAQEAQAVVDLVPVDLVPVDLVGVDPEVQAAAHLGAAGE